MKVTITQAVIDKAQTRSKPYEIRDKKLVGFLIRVQPTGKMTYYCEYRRGGRVKIGPESAYSVKSARVLARQIIAEFHQGGEPAITAKKAKDIATYQDFLEEHYFKWVEANHNASGATKRCLLSDCAPFLKKKLDDITPQSVEKWRIGRVASGLSPHTANRSYATLRASLSKAEEWGIIAEHPLRKMKLLKTDSNLKVRYLSNEEEKRLREALGQREAVMRSQRHSGNLWREQRHIRPMVDLETVPFCDHLKPMVLISINTGLRRGELFSLEWKNINFDLRQLTVEGTNGKSRKSRHVPLNEEAYFIISAWQSQKRPYSNFVFPNQNGQRFKDIKTSWKSVLSSAQIKDFRWHDLRHHFASRLAMEGVDLNTIRELLGHSSYEMTLRYAHLSAGHKAEAVKRLIKKADKELKNI
ncbi:tyrosine-type recombinase/integrase [Litorimonas sp. WD9-15]|uniref:tyrosine-type recombinase/integrase n=1 Tax=Litorimonas sp. WD9-15 TaxID=3418716 RepID=UPI003D03D886